MALTRTQEQGIRDLYGCAWSGDGSEDSIEVDRRHMLAIVVGRDLAEYV